MIYLPFAGLFKTDLQLDVSHRTKRQAQKGDHQRLEGGSNFEGQN